MAHLDASVVDFPAIRPQIPLPKDDDSRKPESMPIDFQDFPGPGILAVRIHSGVGLSVPQYEATPKQPQSDFFNLRCLLLPYVNLECDGSEVHINAFQGTKENPEWKQMGERTFDIFKATDLRIRIYARNPNDYRNRSRDTFLGCATMNIVFGDGNSRQMDWLPIENGTGKLLVESDYQKNTTLQIETSKRKRIIGDSRFGFVYKIRKMSTDRFYTSIDIRKADILPQSDVVKSLLSPINNSLFIAPLKFIAQTQSYICLYWPFISGGHLFYHLQQALRFQPDRAQLYAAEILVALELLHEVDPSYYELKPKNILLDSAGHIVLCDLGFLRIETRNMDTTTDVTLDYQAPELLSGHVLASTTTTSSKWWAFGCFLFEMLTGLPPFYDEDTEQRRHNILSEPPEISRYLSASAQDLLNKLLSRNPEMRLGANGASEIKAHHFFDGLNWDKVARREYEPIFKPHECEMVFRQEKHHAIDGNDLKTRFSGFSWNTPVYKEPIAGIDPYESINEEKYGSRPIVEEITALTKSIESATERKDDWDLVWRHEDQEFYFYNHFTKTEKPIISNRKQSQKQCCQVGTRKPQGGTACVRDVSDANVDTLPDPTQCQEALEAVLVHRYMHLIPALLKDYSLNLDMKLQLEGSHTTAINYVTELEDVDTVRLFLENGANANLEYTFALGGRPLLTAVNKENQDLTEILVQRTDRIPCTSALSYAVSKRNISITKILLANGVKCDFQDSDRPSGPGPCVPDWDWNLNATVYDASEADEYIPPLIRAILSGELYLVQLLLTHRADVNIGYHDLNNSLPGIHNQFETFHMRCGRPIQLATELGRRDMVQLLLCYGADIDLAQPIWQYHYCEMIPRAAYHEITSLLRSLAAHVIV